MCFDRAEGTQKMQGYLVRHIFECFNMRMEDLWTAHAQSQALNFTHYARQLSRFVGLASLASKQEFARK